MTIPAGSEKPASLPRRLAAVVYDGLLLFAVLFLATAFVLPLNDNQAIESGSLLYLVYLITVSFLYFGWFWTHSGQTLGMCAWSLRVQTAGGGHQALDWKRAAMRFIAGGLTGLSFGAGFLFALWDTKRRCLHDRLSGTMVIVINDGHLGKPDGMGRKGERDKTTRNISV